MLITLELLFCTDLRRSLATLGELNTERNPALESAIADYMEQNATTPPGVWVRSYKGRNWLTQSAPGLPFFAFLADWRSVPAVAGFIDTHYRFVQPSPGAMSDVRVNVWIGWPDGPDPVAVGAAPPDDDYAALVA
ncbi:hypothetical protein OSO23_000210 [Salmonella enterica subsp. enterica serovar Thompson]|nr:hypothetical protein [Salmonella enterica subsp. enterica serovar Thompson]EKB6157699.1 hypothetical protein [Salmonella enterica]EKD6185730.1 hypothetical protein [Salmonella enterica subsp. enterica serovar Thompson]EKK3992814.1 hypothetical protein [Salmonella enterica]